MSEQLSVFMALPCHTNYPPEFVTSFGTTMAALTAEGIATQIAMVRNKPTHYARSMLCDAFLKSECDIMACFDYDMQWTAEQFLRLLALSDQYEVVSTACVGRSDTSPPMFNPMVGASIDENGLIEVKSVGFCVSVIKRHVVQAVSDRCQELVRFAVDETPIKSIFRYENVKGNLARLEDYCFCDDIRAAGFKIFVDTTICPGHVGSKVYRYTSVGG